MEKIIIKADVFGNVQVKVEGVAGKDCLSTSANIEAALGKTSNDTPTPEMDEVNTNATVANRA